MKVILSRTMQKRVEKRESLLRRSIFRLDYVSTAQELLEALSEPGVKCAVVDTGLEGFEDGAVRGGLASRLNAMGLNYLLVEHRRRAFPPHDPLVQSCSGVLRFPFSEKDLLEEIEKQIQLTRRNNIRARVTLDVKCEYTFHLFTGEIKNLSKSGIMLETDVSLNLGSAVRLDFSIPEVGYFISAHGKVMWSMADGANGCHRYGVAFSDMQNEDKKMIDLFVRQQALG